MTHLSRSFTSPLGRYILQYLMTRKA